MTSTPTIQTNVDIFSDNGSYFVRSEIEARSVHIHGPLQDLAAAQKQQASQAQHMQKASEALKQHLLHAVSAPAEGG
jgi:hypothetical protein